MEIIPYTVNAYQDIGPKPCTSNYLVRSQLGRGSARLHSTNFSIKLVLAGGESYCTRAKRFNVNAGQFLLAAPGEDFLLDINSAAQGCCVYLEPNYVNRLMHEYCSPDIEGGNGEPLQIANMCLPHQNSPIGLAVAGVANRQFTADRHMLSVALAETLVHLSHLSKRLHCTRAATAQELLTRLERAKNFIFEAKQQCLTLEDIESAACLSRFHLTRLFTRLYGEPPLRFHQNLKLDMAREHIEAGVPITQLASELGFSSVSAFSRAYRRRHRTSPSNHQPQ